MHKILILFLLINISLSTPSFSQIEAQSIEIDNIVNTTDTSLTPKILLKIKKYKLLLTDSMERQTLLKNINPKWIKSIEILKPMSSLGIPIYRNNNSTVIITLKRRKWKKLSKTLRGKFEKAGNI